MSEYKNSVQLKKSVPFTLYDSYKQDFLSMREAVGDIKGGGVEFNISRDLNGMGFYVERNYKGRLHTAYVDLTDLLKFMAETLIENEELL